VRLDWGWVEVGLREGREGGRRWKAGDGGGALPTTERGESRATVLGPMWRGLGC
jgi:hypothetical protein